MEQSMEDGIRNIFAAQTMIEARGRPLGPIEYANKQLEAQPSDDAITTGFEQIANQLKDFGERLLQLEQK